MTLILTVVIFPVVGAAAASVLRLPVPASPAARIAFLFLLGLGAQGALLYALGVLRVPLGAITFATIPLASIVLLVVNRKFLVLLPHLSVRGRTSGLLFAVPLVVLFCAAAVIPTRDYDGRATWLPKARAIALEESVAGPFFHGQRGLNLHNRYPLLLPLDAATVMRLGNDTRNEAARWIYVLIPIAAFVVLRSMLCAWFGSTGAWVAAIPPWLPMLTTIEGGALAAYSDIALAAFIGIAVLYLIESLNDARALRVAGLFGAFAVMTKNEGVALALALAVAASLVRRWKVVIPIAMAEAVIVYGRSLVPPAYDEQYEVLIAALPRSIARVPEAMAAIGRHSVDFSEWGFFWIAFATAIVVCLIRDRSMRFAIPLTTIVLALAAYVAALAVTSWRIDDLAPVAVNRLLTQLVIPATCILAMAVHALGKRPGNRSAPTNMPASE